MTLPDHQPRRIQRCRTKGWRAPEGVVYVGRPTRFANPFMLAPASFIRRGGLLDMWAVQYQGRTLGRWDDIAAARADATDRYARWLREPEQEDSRSLFRALLHGRDLMCWCPLPADGQPDHCHGAVLLRLANQETER